jgi:hypothetical protein
MKNIIFIISFLLLGNSIFSQDTITFKPEKNINKDVFLFDLYTDLWQDVPSNVKVREINQGVNAYFMLNRPIKTTNFSLAFGIGVSSHNFYSDAIPILGRNALNQLDGTTTLVTLGNYYTKAVNYSINKVNVTYIDIPLELRFKTREDRKKRINISAGFKIGYNISNHSKYKGDDVIEETDDQVIIKKSNIKNISDWNYGIVGRLGYGNLRFMVYYSLSKLFDENKGPQMYPISIGITFSPL